jgi:hypothetical protein
VIETASTSDSSKGRIFHGGTETGSLWKRNFAIKKYKFTPYVRAEFFYDSRFDKISKNAITIGSVFPLSKRTEFEVYFEDQRDSGTSPNFHVRGAGLVLGLYF